LHSSTCIWITTKTRLRFLYKCKKYRDFQSTTRWLQYSTKQGRDKP